MVETLSAKIVIKDFEAIKSKIQLAERLTNELEQVLSEINSLEIEFKTVPS
ncbi:MAG TPA: hypothetical protein VFV31_00690 [Chitinophagaceae bacterium]|nr:hypothetical protein [Chitinophagaceae bacterium]